MTLLNSDSYSHNHSKTKGASLAGASIKHRKEGSRNILRAYIMLAIWRRHTRAIIGIAKGKDMQRQLGGCRSSQFNRRQLIKQRLNGNSFDKFGKEGGKNV